jgi:hypothetical protein
LRPAAEKLPSSAAARKVRIWSRVTPSSIDRSDLSSLAMVLIQSYRLLVWIWKA